MRWRRVVALVLVVASTTGYVAATQSQSVLVVADADTGTQLRTIPVDDGTTVTLTYTHSVEKTPVQDQYTVDGATLDNTRMRFKSYGWGLPATANVTLQDGWFVYDPDRRYDAITIQTGTVAGHELVVDETTYDLVELADGDAVTITVERRPHLSILTRPTHDQHGLDVNQ
jgi:hypothetical protein